MELDDVSNVKKGLGLLINDELGIINGNKFIVKETCNNVAGAYI